MWKIEHGVLPVKDFLSKRIHASNFSVMCGWCGNQTESIQHLMKDCVLATWVWEDIALWWDIPFSRFCTATFSLRNMFTLVEDVVLHKVWKSVVAAGLWYIWISRNNKVFNQVNIDRNTLSNNIKLRGYRWSLISQGIEEDCWMTWKSNPRLAVKKLWLLKKDQLWKKCQSKYDLICMVDGAFLQINKAGIGGCIKDSSGNLLYIFFGPYKAKNSCETEWAAAVHMINEVVGDNKNWRSLCLCSDSRETILRLKNIKLRKNWQELGLLTAREDRLDKISYLHVGREFNMEADGLAKAGMSKNRMVQGWL